MASTEVSEKCFTTRRGELTFSINVSCLIELSAENIDEIIKKGSRKLKDEHVFNDGIDIRDTLSQKQKAIIKSVIDGITKNSYDYCVDNDVINVKGQHLQDKVNQPLHLKERGWDTDELEFYEQIINTLCNVTQVEKTKVSFRRNGDSLPTMTYTIQGEHEGYRGRIALRFDTDIQKDGTRKTIMIVTVLSRNKIENVMDK